MEHVLPVTAVLVFGAILIFALQKRYVAELGYVVVAFFAHMASAVGQVWLVEGYYQGGDMLHYFWYGRRLARVLEIDFWGKFPYLIEILFQSQSVAYDDILGAGSATGSMSAIAGFLMFVLGGSSYASCMAIALMAVFGKLGIYEVFRSELPEAYRKRLLFAVLLMPSVVFWSSGVLKESVAITGIGFAFVGVYMFFDKGRPLAGFLAMVGGVAIVALLKPYVLFPFVVSTALWRYWKRSLRLKGAGAIVIKPVFLVAAAGMGVGGIVLLGRIFPEYAIDQFTERAAFLQQVGKEVGGGSTYELVSGEVLHTPGGQLLYAPLALVTSLFRPFFFEVKSALMAVNAVETTALLLFVYLGWRRRGWSKLVGFVWARPLFMFCLAFTVLFGTGIGLATTNMGTLSRYRIPMMPFWVTMVLVLAAPKRVEELAAKQASTPPPPPRRMGRAPRLLPRAPLGLARAPRSKFET